MGRKELAQQLKDEGKSYAEIGRIVGCAPRTAQRWLCEETRKKDAQSNIRSAKRGGYKYRKTPKGRVVSALAVIKVAARKRGHMPCTTPADEIVDRVSDVCDMCGKHENENGQSLCLDHNHTSGEFRGWLCTSCNISLGHYETVKERAERYLNDTDTL